MARHLGSIIGVTLGGQKRRLGRFLFSAKVTEFQEQIRSLVRDLQSEGSTDVTFHVCTGLAGGTGSGSLIDVLAQLRNTYPDAKRYRIILYALLPEVYPNPSWDTGNYHSNGYAALLELNALSVGAYQPYDVSGKQGGRFKLSDPFNGAWRQLAYPRPHGKCRKRRRNSRACARKQWTRTKQTLSGVRH